MGTQPAATPSPTPEANAPASVAKPEVNDLNASRSQIAAAKATQSKETPKDNKVPPVKETPKPFKTGKYNLNGKMVEKTWMTEAEMDRDLQKTFGIEEKAQLNAAKVEMAEKLLDYVQGKDPADYKKFVKLCKENGIDHKKFASDILYDEIEIGNLTPEQRELKEYKDREAEAKAEQEESQRKVLDSQKEQKKMQDIQAFEKECSDALNKGALPKTRLTLGILSQYVEAADAANKESGGKIVQSVEQLLPFVKRDLIDLQNETFKSLEGKALLEAIGPDLLEKITKAKVADYKQDLEVKPKPTKAKEKSKNPKDNSFRTQMNKKPLDDDETGGIW